MIYRLRVAGVKYGAIALTNLQNQLAYVWDALNRAFLILLFMFIFAQLWRVAFAAQGVTEIAGMTLADTIWYFLIAEVMQLGQIRHDVNITQEVKDGSIAYTIGKPYNYLVYHFSNGLGESALRMSLIFLLGAPVALYYAGIPTLSLLHLPFVFGILFIAILVDFCILSVIGLLAFITEDTSSFRLIYQKITFILGGLLIPLDFLPEWLQRVAGLLPFQLTAYAPARLFVAFSWSQFWQLLVSGLIWLAILGLILWRQYRWATRRLAINGG
ncbi:MAG: ABC-2 family transporter protein [Candidatus Promineifilaceae bacterium]